MYSPIVIKSARPSENPFLAKVHRFLIDLRFPANRALKRSSILPETFPTHKERRRIEDSGVILK